MIISYHMLNANSLPIRKGDKQLTEVDTLLAESVYFYTMYTILVFLVIGLFVAILFLQFYFRMKVLKVYRVLVQHRVQFQPGISSTRTDWQQSRSVIRNVPRISSSLPTI